MASFDIGSKVETEKNGSGTVAFIGTTQFADGDWVGIILDEAKGKNNGTVKDVEYFKCEMNYGLFVRPTQLKPLNSGVRTRSMAASALKAPGSNLRKDSAASRSGKPSPAASPRMSPAVSMEKVAPTPRKVSSNPRLDKAAERKSSAAAPKPPIPRSSNSPQKSTANSKATSRESSNLSQADVKKAQSSTKRPEELPVPAQPQTPKDNVKNLVKNVEQHSANSSAPTPTQPPLSLEELTDREQMRLKIKELEEKLETLRAKRKEDFAKISEYDRCRIQLQQLQEIRSKLTDQNLDLLRQLEESKGHVAELRAWRDSNQEKINNFSDDLELLTIDKEVAEERCNQMKEELAAEVAKNEELTTELKLLREEMESGAGASAAGANSSAVDSVKLKQLQVHNDKMKDAILMLKTTLAEETRRSISYQKDIEAVLSDNVELVSANEVYKKRVTEAEQRILDYQEQVEAAMGSEEMVTILTTKNIDLEEECRVLKAKYEELEQERDMDEQIFEEQREMERGLRHELEEKAREIHDLHRKIKDDERHVNKLTEMIAKFKSKVAVLNEEIQNLKDQVITYESERRGVEAEEKSVASMVSQMQVNANRVFSETVERQVNNIELEYAKKQVGYLKAFLPDNFTKSGGDNDLVLLNVLFPRLSNKAKLFAKLAAEKYPHVPGGIRREHITKTHKSEQWAHVAYVAHLCAALVAVCGQFESAIQNMSVERLVRLGQLQTEMSAHERAIDNYLDLLKQGRFDDNTSLEYLTKALMYFQNVYSVHVSGDTFATNNWVAALIQQMVSTIAWSRLNVKRINLVLTPGSESCEVAELTGNLSAEFDSCEQLTAKALKSIPSGVLRMTPAFKDELTSTVSVFEQLASILHEACSTVSSQIHLNTDADGFEPGRVKEIIHAAVEKLNGSISLEKAFSPLLTKMSTVRTGLTNIVSALESGNLEEPATEKKTTFPAMLERAHLRKQAAAEAEGLRWQLEKKDVEIVDLKRNIKSRLDDISNYKLRLDMVEARMDSSGKQESETVQMLESKVEQLNIDIKKQRIEFDQSLDNLEKELKEVQKENEELRKNQKNMSKMQLLQGIQSMENRAASSANASPTSAASPLQQRFLEHQLAEAQTSLKQANLNILRMRVEAIQAREKGGALKIPDLVSGPETLKSRDPLAAELDAITKEADHLKREHLKYSVYIADPTKSREAQEEERREFYARKADLAYQVEVARARLRKYWNSKHPNQPIPQTFATGRTITKQQPLASKFDPAALRSIINQWGTTSA